MAYEMLFSPMKIGTMEVKNRVVMTAAEFSLGQTNGEPTERMIAYYEERARGGVGLIIPGICRVNDMAATSTFTQLSMSKDRHIEPMRAMVDRIHAAGAKLCIQLHHPGRQGYGSSINSLPFIIPLTDRFPALAPQLFKATPLLLALEQKRISFSQQAPSKGVLSAHGAMRIHAMSRRKVKKLIEQYVCAAVRCQKAGVDAVELHGTHGYMIHQFLSPHTNRRTDEYGGSFENRLRFLAEIVEGIKRECGKDYPLIVRLTADEMYAHIGKPGQGYTIEEGKEIAKRLEALGVDAINVSCACYDTYNYWLEPTSFEPGWRAYLAKEIKSVVNIPVIAANFIRSPEQAERQLQEGCQDFIGSARNFICDPDWAKKAEEGHPEQIRRCIGCLHCIKSFIENASLRGAPGECALNPFVGHEALLHSLPQDGIGKTAVVVGAGPAGLTAAIVLRRRGFTVTVFEKEKEAGGQVNIAAAGPHKEKLHWAIEDMLTEAKGLGINLRCGMEPTASDIVKMKADVVFIATGGTPLRPASIPGIEGDTVYTASDVLLEKVKLQDKKVAVIGSGLTGLETVEKLNEDGNRVIVIEMAPAIAEKAWFQLTEDAMSRIKPYGTRFLLNTRLLAVGKNGVRIKHMLSGKEKCVAADAVVLAMGVKPENALAKQLALKGVRCEIIGDAAQSGTIGNATQSAFKKAMEIK